MFYALLCWCNATQPNIVALNHIIVFANNFDLNAMPVFLALLASLDVDPSVPPTKNALVQGTERGCFPKKESFTVRDQVTLILSSCSKHELKINSDLSPSLNGSSHHKYASISLPTLKANHIIAMAITKPPQIHNHFPVIIASHKCIDYFDSFALRCGTKAIKCHKTKLTFE